MQIALALYERFTALDIIGPFQVLAGVPGHDVFFVAAEAGPVMDHTGRCPLTASRTFAEVTAPDVVVVPGGPNAERYIPDHDHLVVATGAPHHDVDHVRVHGLDPSRRGRPPRRDRRHHPHWATYDVLSSLGAHPTATRVVERGKIITGAGVSAGIDMALTLLDRLHGPVVAQAVQLGIEYDPQPPFDSGSPAKAPQEVMDLVMGMRASR